MVDLYDNKSYQPSNYLLTKTKMDIKKAWSATKTTIGKIGAVVTGIVILAMLVGAVGSSWVGSADSYISKTPQLEATYEVKAKELNEVKCLLTASKLDDHKFGVKKLDKWKHAELSNVQFECAGGLAQEQ